MPEYREEHLKLRAQVKEAIFENISEAVQRSASKLYCLLEDNEDELQKLAHSFGLPVTTKHLYDKLTCAIEDMIFEELGWSYTDMHSGFMPDEYETLEEPRPRALMVLGLRSEVPEYYKTLEAEDVCSD